MRTLPLLLALAACAPTLDDDLDPDLRVDVPHATDRVLVGLSGTRTPAIDGRGLNLLAVAADFAVVEVPAGYDALQTVMALRRGGTVAWAEPDRQVAVSGWADVDDTYRAHQWNLDQVGAEEAWAHATGAGVIVAVVDSGVSEGPRDGLNHLLPGTDLVDDDDDAADVHGHGTHVAGTIAQATDNGAGVAGLAPEASILPVRVLGADGTGWTSDVALGVAYAVDQGADVVNLSLGSSTWSHALCSTVARAADEGVVVVAATGNDGLDEISYPAACPGAIAVGAVDGRGERTSYSNGGERIDLVAPGGDWSRDDDGDGVPDAILQETVQEGVWGYWLFQGTSMATPHVAASAALLLSAGVPADEVEDLLVETALDVGEGGWDEGTGYGVVQPAAAVEAWLGTVEEPPAEEVAFAVYDVRFPKPEGQEVEIRFETTLPSSAMVCSGDFRRCRMSETAWGTGHRVVFPNRPMQRLRIFAMSAEGEVVTEGPFAVP